MNRAVCTCPFPGPYAYDQGATYCKTCGHFVRTSDGTIRERAVKTLRAAADRRPDPLVARMLGDAADRIERYDKL